MNASLNEKLRTVKWGEFKITNLFKPLIVQRKIKGEDVVEKGMYPAYSSNSENNGIIGYYSTPEFICDSTNPVYVVFGDHTRTMSIAHNSFSVLDNVKVLRPNIENTNVLLFIFSIWKKQIPNLGYKRHWGIAKKCILRLPITSDGSINFDFMESFIAELEAERVAELEAERAAELTAYLKVSGLDNYELSSEEENALEDYRNIQFSDFDILQIFSVNNTHNILSDKIISRSGDTPYLCASAENNSVNSYISYDEKYLEKGNCIFIGGKTFTVTYQESDFFSNDSHNLALYEKDIVANKLKQLYIVTCIKKSMSHKYSWGDSVSKTKIKTDKISLPQKGGKPDYDTMDLLISAVQKLVIKDVVLYTGKKIEKTKEATKK